MLIPFFTSSKYQFSLLIAVLILLGDNINMLIADLASLQFQGKVLLCSFYFRMEQYGLIHRFKIMT